MGPTYLLTNYVPAIFVPFETFDIWDMHETPWNLSCLSNVQLWSMTPKKWVSRKFSKIDSKLKKVLLVVEECVPTPWMNRGNTYLLQSPNLKICTHLELQYCYPTLIQTLKKCLLLLEWYKLCPAVLLHIFSLLSSKEDIYHILSSKSCHKCVFVSNHFCPKFQELFNCFKNCHYSFWTKFESSSFKLPIVIKLGFHHSNRLHPFVEWKW